MQLCNLEIQWKTKKFELLSPTRQKMVDDEYFISEKFPNTTNGVLMTFSPRFIVPM